MCLLKNGPVYCSIMFKSLLCLINKLLLLNKKIKINRLRWSGRRVFPIYYLPLPDLWPPLLDLNSLLLCKVNNIIKKEKKKKEKKKRKGKCHLVCLLKNGPVYCSIMFKSLLCLINKLLLLNKKNKK